VDEEKDGAPDYYATVDDPIDLQTIEFKVRNNIYRDSTFFHADMEKMWSNSRKYNEDNPFMLKITKSIEKRYLSLLKSYRPNLLINEECKSKEKTE
jgi:histone acetyltransferase